MNKKQAMNRAQRRKEERENRNPKVLRGTKQELLTRMAKNGITMKELEHNYVVGFETGEMAGIRNTYTKVYAAFILAANELYGFGFTRSKRLVKRADELVASHILSDDDAVNKVWDRVGLKLDMKLPFGNVEDKTE